MARQKKVVRKTKRMNKGARARSNASYKASLVAKANREAGLESEGTDSE